MQKNLIRLNNILENFPEADDATLAMIPTEQASIIWKFAKLYLECSMDMTNSIEHIQKNLYNHSIGENHE